MSNMLLQQNNTPQQESCTDLQPAAAMGHLSICVRARWLCAYGYSLTFTESS